MTRTDERRKEARIEAADVADVLRARVRPGHQVVIVNLSARGALIECSRRMLPGTIVELHIDGEVDRHVSKARVVRCYVNLVLPEALVYRSGLALESPIGWLPLLRSTG